jgi:hypothetical protein
MTKIVAIAAFPAGISLVREKSGTHEMLIIVARLTHNAAIGARASETQGRGR